MAAQRAATDPDTTSFVATVESADGSEVTLDQTYFYAESGGQPPDRGTLDGVPVEDVQLQGDTVVHSLVDAPEFKPGERIEGVVDPNFRTYCRRAHTASHVVYGVARTHLEDLGYGGFGIDETKVRIDFETSTDVDADVLVDLQRDANLAVWESRPVTWEPVPMNDVRERPEIAFNTKTEDGVFGAGRDVRIVEVGPPTLSDGDVLDEAACGGTHVRNTREIGPIAILDRSNPGEGLTRIEIAVGPPAVEHDARVARAARGAARSLGTAVEEIPERVAALEREREDLASELREAIDARIAADLAQAHPVQREGEPWLIETIDGANTDALARHARRGVAGEATVVALVSGTRPASVTVATDGSVDASEIVEEISTEFGGGGGGGPEFAQGGGLDVDPGDLVAYLEA